MSARLYKPRLSCWNWFHGLELPPPRSADDLAGGLAGGGVLLARGTRDTRDEGVLGVLLSWYRVDISSCDMPVPFIDERNESHSLALRPPAAGGLAGGGVLIARGTGGAGVASFESWYRVAISSCDMPVPFIDERNESHALALRPPAAGGLAGGGVLIARGTRVLPTGFASVDSWYRVAISSCDIPVPFIALRKSSHALALRPPAAGDLAGGGVLLARGAGGDRSNSASAVRATRLTSRGAQAARSGFPLTRCTAALTRLLPSSSQSGGMVRGSAPSKRSHPLAASTQAASRESPSGGGEEYGCEEGCEFNRRSSKPR